MELNNIEFRILFVLGSSVFFPLIMGRFYLFVLIFFSVFVKYSDRKCIIFAPEQIIDIQSTPVFVIFFFHLGISCDFVPRVFELRGKIYIFYFNGVIKKLVKL